MNNDIQHTLKTSAHSADSVDQYWMQHALGLALKAESEGEVPVGAVVIKNGELVGEGWNRNIALNDPSAHAEILALRDAGSKLGNHRLTGCDLYVTLEPCVMCLGACIHARLERLVFGASDPKTGALGGRFELSASLPHNHSFNVLPGVLKEASASLLKAFFKARR